MDIRKKSIIIFIWFTFSWSYIFWGLSIYFSINNNIKLLENTDTLNAILKANLGEDLLAITILNILAGYGPLLGAIFISIFQPATREYFKNKFKFNTSFKYTLQIVILFLLITIIPAIFMVISKGLQYTEPWSWSMVQFLLMFFLYQLITASTEEVGWRGFLLPAILEIKTPWNASVRIGIIWALWHTPIIMYVFYSQDLAIIQILISFIGFIAGTIAMATVHTYYYLKTKNILFNMFIHGISNTLPMFVGMLFLSSYEIAVGVQVLLWAFVIFITKKEKTIFDSVQK